MQKIVHNNLNTLGGIKYDDKENEYASEIYSTFIEPDIKIGSQENVRPFITSHGYGSTDVGYVSWNEIPSIKSLAGALLVIISSIIIFRREIALKKQVSVTRHE